MPLSVFPWNDLADPVSDGVRQGGFKSSDNPFFCPKELVLFLPTTLFSLSVHSFYSVGVVGLGSSD